MKKKALLPNLFTAFSLACGLFVIFKANMVTPGNATYHQVLTGTIVLMFAAFCDVMDGALARAMKAESEFGGVFDAMSDGVAFGVAPTVLILKTLSVQPGTFLSFFVMTGAMVYAISGVLRLVRFRVLSHEAEESKEKKQQSMKNFVGMPIPAAASVVISVSLLLASEFVEVSDACRVIIAGSLFFIVGYFMVSRWKFPSLKTFNWRVTSFRWVFLSTVIAVGVLVGALQAFPIVFAVLSCGYFVTAIVLSLVRIASGKRLASLEDYEPAPDEDE